MDKDFLYYNWVIMNVPIVLENALSKGLDYILIQSWVIRIKHFSLFPRFLSQIKNSSRKMVFLMVKLTNFSQKMLIKHKGRRSAQKTVFPVVLCSTEHKSAAQYVAWLSKKITQLNSDFFINS